MFKKKPIMVVGLAAIVLSGLASTSALGVTAGWRVNGRLLEGTKALARRPAASHTTITTATGTRILCSGTVIVMPDGGVIINPPQPPPPPLPPPWINPGKIVFEECSATEPEACKLKSASIETVPLSYVELTLEGALAARGVIKPSTKTTLYTVGFEGEKCALSGVQPATGSLGFLLPEAQDERTTQTIAVSTSSGQFKIGSSEAEMHVTYLQALESGEPWSFL